MSAYPIGTSERRQGSGPVWRLLLRCFPLFPLGLAITAASACATYRDDLDRAVAHYNDRQYDRAVVLFDVLEPDLDSLSVPERARYAYYRGMSHFLAEQRRDARHWLGRAAAREKVAKGSLHPDEVTKMEETLGDLNQDRWGGASTPSAKPKACEADADCAKGQFCDDGSCRDAPGSDQGGSPEGAEPSGSKDDAKASSGGASSDGGCERDADCSGTLVCTDGRCVKP